MAQPVSMNHYSCHTLSLTGQGSVIASPDLAVIRLGVETTGPNLAEVQQRNAEISQNIILTLKQSGINEMKTYQYMIDRQIEYEDGKQIEKGFTVRNLFEIKTNQLEQIGFLIDSSVQAGANIIDTVSFGLSDSGLFYQNALNLAVDNAIQKAKSIASNLHIRLNSTPVKITELSSMPFPVQQFQREMTAVTPVIPGDLEIIAVISADFNVA